MLRGNQPLCCALILEFSAVLTVKELVNYVGGTRVSLVPELTLICLTKFVYATVVVFVD